MELMYKDDCICQFNIKNGEVRIYKELPFDLYVEESDAFDDRINNLNNIYHWGASRVLSLDRMYAKEILNACCLSQATTDKDKFYVSLKYNALSLRDCFWIKTSEEQTWGEINLFQNSLQKSFIDVSLKGKSMTIENAHLMAPDCSAQGVASKAWIKTENGIFLLKGEISGTDAVRKEVEASQILKDFGFDVVDYEKDIFDGMTVSKSKCYTSLDCNIVSAEGYMENNSIKELFQKEKQIYNAFLEMQIADYLVGNTDRHWENWELWFDDNRKLSMGKLMDFNHAFEATEDTANLPYQVVYSETVSQEKAAIDAIRKRNLHLKKIDFSKYYYGEYVKARYEKMKEKV